MKIKRLLKSIFIILVCAYTFDAFAAECPTIFPDAVQNSNGSGSINFNFNASVINSPDNVLDTRDLIDNSLGTSCNSTACSSSNTVVPTGDFNTFPNGQPDVSLGFNATQTISPGNYDELTLSSSATLRMEPGIYAFRGDISLGFNSEIIIDSPGAVTIFARRALQINSSVNINTAGADRYLFIYSRQSITLGSSSTANAFLYSRQDITLNSQASVVGAVTARGDISLGSPAFITYDNSALDEVDFDSFCEPVVFPELVAEWRLDELSWNGSSGEVLDSSVNALHGTAVNNNGFPDTEGVSPVVSGTPGTCRYGDFNGTADGYVEIPDPGLGSVLDLGTAFSVTSWVYARTFPASGLSTIVSKDENFEYHLTPSGTVNWWWGGGDRELTSTASVSLNTWHHVAITYESGEQHIYIDGVSVGTNNSTTAITLNNDSVFISTDFAFHSRRFNGRIDEVRIYSGALSASQVNTVMNETHDCILESTLDHFDINVGSSSASVCSPKEITITALDAANAPLTDYVGEISLTTSTGNGDWDNTSTASDALNSVIPGAADSGQANYQFELLGNDNGVIIIELNNEHAETLNITVEDSSAGVADTSTNITFSENAFVVEENDSYDDDVIAGRRHQYTVTMLRRNASAPGGECGAALNYDRGAVKAWITRSAADPGGAAPTLFNADSSSSLALPNATSALDNITFPFIAGVASFSLDTSDVGEYSIEFLDDSLVFSDTNIAGGSTVITARPFAFEVTVQGNPRASSATGSDFIAAGNAFTIDVVALGWGGVSEDNAPADGAPDIFENTDIADNLGLSGAALPSFGLETPAETLTLSASLFAPSGGNPGALSPANPVFNSFAAGSDSRSDISFSEVGIIVLSAQITDGNYMGAGAINTEKSESDSTYVGRFIPAGFESNTASITESCVAGGYSYLGESFGSTFSINAVNISGTVTQNYTGAFAKLNSTLGTFTVTAIDDALPTSLNSRVSLNAPSTTYNWLNGVGTISSEVTINRESLVLDGPFNAVDLGAQVIDDDDVALLSAELDLDSDNDTTNDSLNIGMTNLWFGRLRLSDASGPETANLPVEFITEYWNGASWQQNTSDDCTQIQLSEITYPDGTIDTPANKTATVSSSTTTGVYGADDGTFVSFTGGDAGHFFTAPGAGNTGSVTVDVDLTLYPWLRFDWDQDGNYDEQTEVPTATFTFGSYRGHDRIIFWQEVFRLN